MDLVQQFAWLTWACVLAKYLTGPLLLCSCVTCDTPVGGMGEVPTPVSALIAALSQSDKMLTTPLPAAHLCGRSSKVRCRSTLWCDVTGRYLIGN